MGLTGGIATGKSTVAAMLSDLGARIIDADKVAHAVYREGKPAWHAILKHFGRDILLPDNQIDRRKLGQIVFQHPDQKVRLNAIVHPHVKTQIRKRIEALSREDPKAVIVLDVPLLIESAMDEGLSEIIVVYAPESIQMQRLMLRDGIEQTDALSRIRAQMSIEEKKQRATIVIDNSGHPKDTKRQTILAFEKIKSKYGIR